MNRKETVLLTGASGFIGSTLARRLADADYRVICPMRPNCPNLFNLNRVKGIEVITVPVFNFETLAASLDGLSAQVIFNLASYGVKRHERDPQIMIEGNVSLLTALLRVTSAWPLRVFVHAGSCSEYAPPSEEKLLKEEDSLLPRSLYGAAKAASFLLGNALAAQLGVPMITLRLFGVYGNGEAPERLVSYLINKLKNDSEVDLTGGRQIRDLLYVEDVAAAFLAVLESPAFKQGEVFNVCSSKAVSVGEIATTVARLMNKPKQLLRMGEREYRKDEPMWLVGDNRLFRKATDWRQKIDLEEGISSMVAAIDSRI